MVNIYIFQQKARRMHRSHRSINQSWAIENLAQKVLGADVLFFKDNRRGGVEGERSPRIRSGFDPRSEEAQVVNTDSDISTPKRSAAGASVTGPRKRPLKGLAQVTVSVAR